MLSAVFCNVYGTAFAVEPQPTPARKVLPKLSVVMPCLNEAETLATCIGKARNALDELAIAGEVVIADNGSTDGSQEIARRSGARVVDVSERGYGYALRGGVSAALGEWIIIGDADDSYDFGSIAPFVRQLGRGCELVIGCRLPRGNGRIMKDAMPWKHRWIGNPALTFLGRLFFKSPANDFHCGLRAITKDAFLKMNLTSSGMEFASEMVMKASFAKLRVAEVPITLHKDGRSRPPHLRSWQDGWRHLRLMLLHCPLWLFFVPGAVLSLGGIAVETAIATRPFHIGIFGFESNTLVVSSLAIVVGMQLIFFALFARMFAVHQGFLPESRRLKVFELIFTLERGIWAGLLLGGLGLGQLLHAVWLWRNTGFGPLPTAETLRLVVPATTFIACGVELIFASFLLSILRLPHVR
jgi:glycosyltransferase involved in cell wall biosynthesis